MSAVSVAVANTVLYCETASIISVRANMNAAIASPVEPNFSVE